MNNINYRENPYGFISPDGKYHPVEWGEHTEYAYKYIDNNNLSDDFYKWWKDVYGSSTDYLVYNCGWLLIHSPAYGIPYLTLSNKNITKAQRETLFDYYIQTGREKEANALYNE